MAAPRLHAIVPAAGSGQRMGSRGAPKQYAPLLGRPLLAWSLERLLSHPDIDDVTVVLAPDDQHFTQLEPSARVHRTEGGDSRARSVCNGIIAAQNRFGADFVLVHDAARPCLDLPSLDRLIAAGLGKTDGAILAQPVADTLKRARAGDQPAIKTTIDREGLWAAQTPQLFPAATLRAALEASLARGDAPTDEAGAMESAGYHPRLVTGSPRNLKVTWPGDLALAELYLRAMLEDENP